ncbi:hypothetical protein M2266_005983 [Streptomyces sp. SPB162]|nr:hypothetical protein [Streptomyces sp. SPB162]
MRADRCAGLAVGEGGGTGDVDDQAGDVTDPVVQFVEVVTDAMPRVREGHVLGRVVDALGQAAKLAYGIEVGKQRNSEGRVRGMDHRRGERAACGDAGGGAAVVGATWRRFTPMPWAVSSRAAACTRSDRSFSLYCADRSNAA